jgi:hypothetical protein
MVDLATLSRQARRASEWGRLRAAARVIGVVAVLTALAAWVGGAVDACAGAGAVLLVTAIALRWWSFDGARAVRFGLLFGLLPLTATLVTMHLGVGLPRIGSVDVCGIFCMLAGAGAGLGAAYGAKRSMGSGAFVRWAMAGVVASLVAALGCVPMGLGSTVSLVGAVLVGTVVGAGLQRNHRQPTIVGRR